MSWQRIVRRIVFWLVILHLAGFALIAILLPVVLVTDYPQETAEVVWQTLGALTVFMVLTAVYLNTGIAGRRRPSGAHGVLGILTGFVVLSFVTAYLYYAGFVFWVCLLGGIAASVLVKLLFAFWRNRLSDSAATEPGVRFIYRRQEVRRQ